MIMNILNQPHRSLHTANLLVNVQQDLEILFTSISESILLIEANGTIIASNDTSANWLNRSADELAGKNLFTLLTPFGIPIREWVYEATSNKIIFECDTKLEEQFFHIRLIPIAEGHKIRRLILIGQDVTEHKQAEEQVREFTGQMERKVRERTKELEALNQKLVREKRLSEIRASLSQYFMQESRDNNQLLEHITTEISKLIGDICLIALFTSDLTQMEIRAIKDRNPGNRQQQRHLLLNRIISVETNPIASQVLERNRFSAKEISNEEAIRLLPVELAALLGNRDIKALEVFLLQAGDQSLGMLGMARESGELYTEEEISFINDLVSMIALAIQNARLFEQLTESQIQLQGLSEQLVKMQEKQFSRLAEELHDRIGQDMTAINVNLNILRTLLPKDVPNEVSTRLADTEKLVVDSVKHIRSTMAELRPPMLDQYGLTATLYWYCEEYQRRTEIKVKINDRYMRTSRLPSSVEIALFRIAQEALNNVAKHANATQVDIELFAEVNYTMMAIRDNGNGFDTKTQSSGMLQHWGIPLMQERARAIQGEFLLRSVPGRGTQVVVRVGKRI
jgi:signal transduction histidine kinase